MKKISLAILGSFAPVLAFAQFDSQGYVTSVFDLLKTIVTSYIPAILAAAAIGWFMWSLITYIRATPEKKAEQRSSLIYSVIALFVIFSVMGIIRVAQRITGTGGTQQIQTSQIPSVSF